MIYSRYVVRYWLMQRGTDESVNLVATSSLIRAIYSRAMREVGRGGGVLRWDTKAGRSGPSVECFFFFGPSLLRVLLQKWVKRVKRLWEERDGPQMSRQRRKQNKKLRESFRKKRRGCRTPCTCCFAIGERTTPKVVPWERTRERERESNPRSFGVCAKEREEEERRGGEEAEDNAIVKWAEKSEGRGIGSRKRQLSLRGSFEC